MGEVSLMWERCRGLLRKTYRCKWVKEERLVLVCNKWD